jgi:hypothetical protein
MVRAKRAISPSLLKSAVQVVHHAESAGANQKTNQSKSQAQSKNQALTISARCVRTRNVGWY